MSLTLGLASLVVIMVLVRVLLKGRTKVDDNVSEMWLKQDKQRGHDT
jgi:hypothetical protein